MLNDYFDLLTEAKVHPVHDSLWEFELVMKVRRSFLEKVMIKLISGGVTIWIKMEEKHIIARGKTIENK